MDDSDVDAFWGEAKPDMRRYENKTPKYPRQYWYLVSKESDPEKLLFGVMHRVIKKGERKPTLFKKEIGIEHVELHCDDQGVDYAKVNFSFFFFLDQINIPKMV
jgi:hypothetical protein